MKQLLASINFISQRNIHGTHTNRPVIEINWVYLKFAKSQLTRLVQNTPILQDLQHGDFMDKTTILTLHLVVYWYSVQFC